MQNIILLFLGIVCLWGGATLVVESSKRLAARFNVSQTLVGLTIISIGTSLPEIFTNIASGLKTSQGIQASGIAVGTNIGSCLTQITFILGATAIVGTIYATKKRFYLYWNCRHYTSPILFVKHVFPRKSASF